MAKKKTPHAHSASRSEKFTPRVRAFITAYLSDPKHNGTKAAIAAGFSPKTASVQASQTLRNPKVSAEISKRLAALETKVDISVEYVLRNLKEIAERCMTHQPVMEFDHEAKTMVQKTDSDPKTGQRVGVFEFDSSGANKSLELIGRHLKMFTDKLEVKFEEGAFERLERARNKAHETA